MRRACAVVAVVLATGLPAAACGAPVAAPGPAPAGAAPTTPTVAVSAAPVSGGGLSLTLKQYRADEARRVLQVTLGNDAPGTVEVRSVALRAPELADIPPTPRTDTLTRGSRFDVPVDYGAIACHDVPAGPTQVVLEVARDGVAAEVTIDVVRPDPVLDLLERRDCAVQRVAAAAQLSLQVDPAAATDTAMPGRLVARRTGGADDVVVTGTAGSVLFGVTPATTAPVLELGPADTEAAQDLTVTVARCDAHARADSKRSLVLPVWVRVAGDDEVHSTLAVDDATAAAMLTFLERACGR